MLLRHSTDLDIQLPRCQAALQKSCVDQFDSMNCEAATLFCSAEISDPFFATGGILVSCCMLVMADLTGAGYNPYDISKPW